MSSNAMPGSTPVYSPLIVPGKVKLVGEFSERVAALDRRFRKVKEYWRPDRERLLRNQRMHWGVDYAQWPQYIVDKLRDEGRNPPTYNITTLKVEGLAGLLLKNQFDLKYEPSQGDVDSLTLKLQDMYFADKEQMDWDAAYFDFLIHGLVQYGIMEMIISDRHHPLGNISLESINPLYGLNDPDWRSIQGRDQSQFFKAGLFTAEQLRSIYPDKKDELSFEYERQKVDGPDYGVYQGAFAYKELDEIWGDRHLVVQRYYLEKEDRWHEFDIKNGQMFPEIAQEDKQDYIDKFIKPRLGPEESVDDAITWVKQSRKMTKVETAAPTLTQRVLLSDGYHNVQIDRLPIFTWGASRFNGQYRGIVDLMYDLQQEINKGEMDMSDIRRTAARDAFFIDPDIVDNNIEDMKRVEREWNQAGTRMWTKAGALESKNKYLLPFPKASIPPDLVQNVQWKYQLADKLSKQPAAAEGRTESSKESGRLFTAKYEAGLIAQGTMHKGLEMVWNDIGEAYYMQAKITYSGYERTFSKVGGKESFKINEDVATENGIVTLNDISSLPRQKIIITQSPAGLSVRASQRELFAELLNQTPESDVLMRSILFDYIVETLEVSDEKKAEFRNALQLQKMKAGLAVSVDIVSLQQQLQQLQAMAAQMTGQTGVPNPPGGGGPPPPGGGTPSFRPGGNVLPGVKPELKALAGSTQPSGGSEIASLIAKQL